MKNSDHRAEPLKEPVHGAQVSSAPADIEETLETLLAACDEALAHGDDPTPLLDRLADFPAEARSEFAETLACLRALKEREHAPQVTPQPFGKFRLLKVIGQGGFGIVWLAEDPVLGRKVALKMPRLHCIASPESAERFLREAQAAASLEHPNLVPVFEIGQVDGITYLATNYCEGPSLAHWLSQGQPCAAGVAAELVEALARAAAYMHARGIVHRDLKPSNVLLFPLQKSDKPTAPSAISNRLENYIPKITDFGLAHRDDFLVGLTRTGVVLGTPAYMAPEQAWGRRETPGPEADIYALGAILYELLIGRAPFVGDNDLDTLRRAHDDEPIPLRRLRPETPRDLETVCLKCLEKEPNRRYRGMAELADDLQRFREGRPILARPSGRLARVLKWGRRRPIIATLTGMVGLLLVTLIVGSMWFYGREQSNSLDLANALNEAEVQRKVAEERKSLTRIQSYPAPINSAWRQQKTGHLAATTKLLRSLMPADGEQDIRGFEWHYIWRRRHRDFMAWHHDSPVSAIAYAPDGSIIASGGWDKVIHLSDAHDGRLLGTRRGHQFIISSISFLADATRLVSIGHEKNPSGPGFRGELILWSLGAEKGIVRRVYSRHDDANFGHPMFAVAGPAMCAFLIEHGDMDRLRMINLVTGDDKILLSKADIHFVVATPNADTIALSYSDHRRRGDDRIPYLMGSDFLELYDPILGKSKGRIESRMLVAHNASFSPDGKTLVAALFNQTGDRLSIRNVPSLSERFNLPSGELSIGLAFDSRGTLLAVPTQGPSGVQLWDVNTGRRLDQDVAVNAPIPASFSPDGRDLAIGGEDGHVHIRNVAARQDLNLTGPLPQSEAWCVAFTQDGQNLVVGYDHERGQHRETLKIWNLDTSQGNALGEHRGTVTALAVSPNGKELATAGFDATVRLWDLAKLYTPKVLEGHAGPVRAVAYSPDGRLVASAGSDKAIRIWNAADGTLVKSWQGHADMIRTLAFTPDGTLLISGANDDLVKIWNTADYSLIREIREEAHVQSLACSPDGLSLAVANERNNVNLWNLESGTLIRSFLGHGGKVRAVAFAPDGRTLASGGEDKTVRLWHVLTGQEMMSFPVEHFVNGLAFDRHGKRLAAALHNGMVKVWLAE